MCDCHAFDRRSLLRAGAGTVTLAALASFEPAAAGRSRTHTFRGQFTSPATPHWHYLPFRVPRAVREIEVSYDYQPTSTGLGFSYNVVDIGIFDPSGHDLGDADGFRGWSGGARRQFRLSRSGATPGYIPGPISPGVWHVALGPYAIVPPGTPYEVTVTLHFGRPGPRFEPAPAPTAVEGSGPGWYRGDMHLHTVHSDGKRTLAGMVAAAQEAGLDFLGSSEHNNHSASLHWGRVAPPDLLVLNGEEVTTRSGHWLAMGIPAGTWIDWRYRAEDGQLQRFTDLTRAAGGIAIVAHPFIPVPSIRWENGYDYAGIDAIEIWNGPWTGDDQTAVEHWHAMLVEGRFVPVVGNSDSHTEAQPVGTAQTVVRADRLAVAEIIDGVRRGHAWVAESSQVDLTFEASLGGRTASCGDRLAAGPADLVDVRLTATGVPGSVAQLRGPAAVLAGAAADSEGRVEVTASVPAGTAPFVRAEIRRPDDVVVSPADDMPAAQMVALTNPVFLG